MSHAFSTKITKSSNPPVSASQTCQIGIVVIGRNEGSQLERCLASIKGVERVVYVDSASTDNSVEIANSFGIDVVALTSEKPLTAARGRNAGARRLIQLNPMLQFIQFVDGDCELQPFWLEAAQSFLEENPRTAVVCGRRFERFPDRSIYNGVCDREWDTPIGQTQSSGGDALVRRFAFDEVGGFADDQVAHEEPEFCGRLRSKSWEIWRIDVAMSQHDANMSKFGQFYRRSRRAGFGISQNLSRSGIRADDLGRAIVRRAVIWGAILPLSITLTFFLIDWRLALAGISLYAVQWLRIALKTWLTTSWKALDASKVAALSIAGKFAEVHGILEFGLKYLTSNGAARAN